MVDCMAIRRAPACPRIAELTQMTRVISQAMTRAAPTLSLQLATEGLHRPRFFGGACVYRSYRRWSERGEGDGDGTQAMAMAGDASGRPRRCNGRYGDLGFRGSIAVLSVLLPLVGLIVLLGVVFACVHHADVIAHRTGEPYGTLVLTIAVTVIEVALILSIMLAGDGKPTLARETVFSVIMIVCNGVVGLCIILGGLRYGEQGFQVPGDQRLPGRADAARDPGVDPADLHDQRSRAILHAEPAGVRRSRHPAALWRVPLRPDGTPPKLLPVGSGERPRRRRGAGVAAALGERGHAAGRPGRRRAAGQERRGLDRDGGLGDRRTDRGRRASGRVAGAAARDRGGAAARRGATSCRRASTSPLAPRSPPSASRFRRSASSP